MLAGTKTSMRDQKHLESFHAQMMEDEIHS